MTSARMSMAVCIAILGVWSPPALGLECGSTNNIYWTHVGTATAGRRTVALDAERVYWSFGSCRDGRDVHEEWHPDREPDVRRGIPGSASSDPALELR